RVAAIIQRHQADFSTQHAPRRVLLLDREADGLVGILPKVRGVSGEGGVVAQHDLAARTRRLRPGAALGLRIFTARGAERPERQREQAERAGGQQLATRAARFGMWPASFGGWSFGVAL